ncbi:ATP-binding cassette domain-containing protein [Mesomycoplasma molare]|uniref:ABC transporter ATP-binding protein n=1 Tax=Mesomycoplasma molare TaxID=171288 RepID=A0ABY5TV76_9BACT|nr:ABC transporter ATP-binding protein [Mesomycoplasma molare]UWD34547.1 ABC transporter ATP-binding protein [Mesomycoplasma molare]
MKNIIEIENLKVIKNNKNIIDIPKLEIKENFIVSIVGPSGAGKTTLLNVISGFENNIKGKIKIKNDLSIDEIGYILQNNILYEEISVFNNIFLSAKNSFKWRKKTRIKLINDFFINNNLKIQEKNLKFFNHYIYNEKSKKEKILFAFLYFKLLFSMIIKNKKTKKFLNFISIKKEFKKEIDEISKILEIENILNLKTKNLSGGQKQRVAFAKAIIKKNKLFLLDESFSSLDPKIKEKSLDWLVKIKKEFNLSILLVTHDQSDAIKISDYLLILKDGKIEQFNRVEEVLNNPNNFFVLDFFSTLPINKFFWNNNDIFIKSQDIKIDKKDIYSQKGEIIKIERLPIFYIYHVKEVETNNIIKIASKESDFYLKEMISYSIDYAKGIKLTNE